MLIIKYNPGGFSPGVYLFPAVDQNAAHGATQRAARGVLFMPIYGNAFKCVVRGFSVLGCNYTGVHIRTAHGALYTFTTRETARRDNWPRVTITPAPPELTREYVTRTGRGNIPELSRTGAGGSNPHYCFNAVNRKTLTR